MTKRNPIIRAIAVSFLAILVAMPVLSAEKPAVRDAPAPKTMIFIGNSYVYYNNSLHNHTRKLVQSLDKENAKAYFFKATTISASYLSDHAMSAAYMIKDYEHRKKMGPWDLVVLQGHSREAISKKRSKAFRESARKLDAMIRGAGSRTVFFMTWAYRNKPKMTPKLRDAYTKIGNELNALVVPVGLAFALARAEGPDMKVYAKDKRHPSMLGTYLAANVFYATLYGKSPEGAAYKAGLSDAEAKFAQTIAWKAVKEYFGK
jgi:hypothetical protein